jgi:hypothetical protein
MRRHRPVRLTQLAFALGAMFGALGLGVHAAAAVTGAYSVVSFDDRIKAFRPGDSTVARVSDQYRQDLGIQFHEDTVYDVGAPLEGGLARSGPNVLACFGQVGSCPKEIGWSFVSPQGWIEIWVGFDGPHPDGVPISITGSDTQGQPVARTDIVIPASNDPTPVNTPIWAATKDGSATIVRVVVQRGDGDLGSVLIDDVAFAPATPPPDLALTGATLTASNGSISASGSIANVGPVPVDPFTVQIDGPAGTTELSFGGLAPGQSIPLDTTIELPDGFTGQTAHVRIVVAPDLGVPDANPADNVIEENVALPLPPPSAPASEAPSAPASEAPSAPPTVAPSAAPVPTPTPTDVSPLLVGLLAVVGIVLAAAAILKTWSPRPPRPARTAEIRGEATTENGVKVSIDVDGEHATATVEFDQVTVTVDTGGSASVEVKDGPPPKSCSALRLDNLANGQCWYAQRQVTVARADGRVRELKIIVEGERGLGSDVPVPDQLTQRILQLEGAGDRQAATTAVLLELSERATNLAGLVDGASRLTIRSRVAWLKVPAQVTLFACLGTGAEGAFKKLKPLQHSWDILRERDLATGPLPVGEEPGDAIRTIVAAAIDRARRPQPLF